MLRRCLDTLAAQEYPRDRYEVVVVDDGGRPAASRVVSDFEHTMHMKLLRQRNGGPASARNLGAESATGEFLLFTDDDCEPDPHWLYFMLQELHESPDCLVGGRVDNSLVDNPYSAASQFIVDAAYAYYNATTETARFFASNNMGLCRDSYHGVGGFDRSFRTSEDRDLCDRWRQAGGRLRYAHEALVHHAHEHTLGSFWHQHLAYGRGAWRYYRAHRRRVPGSSTIEIGYYCELAVSTTRQTLKRGWRAGGFLAPLLVWQIANTVGFLAEAVASRTRRRAE